MKKSAAKTVPVDAAVQDKKKWKDEIQPEKLPSDAGHGASVASEKTSKVGGEFKFVNPRRILAI